jgi:CBS domain-containing protein
MRVEQAMSSPAVTVAPSTPIKEAAALMASHGYTVLPVVDGNLELVGVVSEGDLLLHRIPSHPSTHSGPVRAPAAATVGEAMTRDVVTTEPKEDIRTLVRRMRASRVRSVPVREHDLVVGMVTLHDLIALVARADERIAADLRRHLDLYGRPGQFDVQVHDGEAVLIDDRDDRTQWHTVRVLAEQVPGVQQARVIASDAQCAAPAELHPDGRWWSE